MTVEAANADETRRSEIAALLDEREDLVRRREVSPADRLHGIVVDENGKDTGWRVKNIRAAMHREQVDADLRKLEDALVIVDRELAARGYEPSRD